MFTSAQDDSALAAKWSISVPSTVSCCIIDDQDSSTVEMRSSGAEGNMLSSAASPAPESHDTHDRDAAVNRQVRVLLRECVAMRS